MQYLVPFIHVITRMLKQLLHEAKVSGCCLFEPAKNRIKLRAENVCSQVHTFGVARGRA